jgi:NitT/TauT family transport system substrate-binding protein
MNSMRLHRRTFAAVTAWSAAVAVTPSLWAQARPEKSKVSIAVGGKSAFYHLPLTVAEQLGYFKAEGLDVEIIDLAGGWRALQSVVGGAVDVASGAYDHIINAQVKGQKLKAFVMQGRAPGIAVGVSLKAMPSFRSIADLKGKKIGVSSPGSSTNMVVNLLLTRAGLKPGDVSFVGVGTSAGALSAFRSGQIDAISNVDPVMTMLEQKSEIRIIGDTRTLKGSQEVFGGPMPASCLYAPADFVKKNPNTVQAMSFAIVRSLKWLQTAGPSDIIKVVPEPYLLGDRALYLAAFNRGREALSVNGEMPEDGPRTAARVMASFDPSVIADKLDLGATFTNEFATKAKERFKN